LKTNNIAKKWNSAGEVEGVGAEARYLGFISWIKRVCIEGIQRAYNMEKDEGMFTFPPKL
jgi:hypothetical protein